MYDFFARLGAPSYFMFRITRIIPSQSATSATDSTSTTSTTSTSTTSTSTSTSSVLTVAPVAPAAGATPPAVTPTGPTRPQGLLYFPDSIPAPLSAELLTWLGSDETTGWFPVGGGANSRRVMHFGYSYDYRSGSVTDPAPEMPDLIVRLRALIMTAIADILPPGYTFDQCIINRYEPRQGISAHIDRQPQYGPIVACFTISSGAEMEFTHATMDTYRLFVEPGSLYVMSGESRSIWKHAMRGRLTDPGHGERGVRYSVTFRSVKLRGN